MNFNDSKLSMSSFELNAVNEEPQEFNNPGIDEFAPGDKSVIHKNSRFY